MSHRQMFTALVLAACAFNPSAAHARLETTLPADRPALQSPAADLTLTFTDPIDLEASHFELIAPNQTSIPLGGLRQGSNGTDVILPIDEELKPGRYTMRWKALSTDGIPDDGSYTFEIKP